MHTILFDLDGTLLPMDYDAFIQTYFEQLAAALEPYGYKPKALIQGVWSGISAMVKNDGRRTNEEVFWTTFSEIFGERVREDRERFDRYYRLGFQKVQKTCGCNPQAKETIQALKQAGYRIVLATNPIFPAVATETRICWAGLNPDDFELYTTYENSSYCKPNPAYYQDLANRLGCRPEECLMVGNDVGEDMVAGTIGMQTFLLTDCLINREEADISRWAHGGFDELLRFIQHISI